MIERLDVTKKWVETTLGEIFELNYGKQLPKRDRISGEVSVYGSNGIVGTHHVAVTSGPTIIIGRKGSIGEIHISHIGCYPIDTTYYIDEFYEQPVKFWYYYLQTLGLKEMNRATAIPGLNRNDAYSCRVLLPSIGEQKQIALKLECLNTHLSNAEKSLSDLPSLLEQLRVKIVDNAFQSTIGKNEVTISDLSDLVTSGSRGWAKYYSNTGAVFIRVGNLSHDSIELKLLDVQHVSPPAGGEGNRTACMENDLVISITADLGRVAIVRKELGAAFVNQHSCLVRLKDSSLAEYVGWYLKSQRIQKQLNRRNRGTIKAGLRLVDINEIKVPVPDKETRNNILADIKNGIKALNSLQLKHQEAKALLDLLNGRLLDSAFSGKLCNLVASGEETPATLLQNIKGRKITYLNEKRAEAKRLRSEKRSKKRTLDMNGLIPRDYLTKILQEKGMIKPEELWKLSKLDIDAFYDQLAKEESLGALKEVRDDIDNSIVMLDAC